MTTMCGFHKNHNMDSRTGVQWDQQQVHNKVSTPHHWWHVQLIEDMYHWRCHILPNNNKYSPSMTYTIHQQHAQPIHNVYRPLTTFNANDDGQTRPQFDYNAMNSTMKAGINQREKSYDLDGMSQIHFALFSLLTTLVPHTATNFRAQ